MGLEIQEKKVVGMALLVVQSRILGLDWPLPRGAEEN